MNKPKGKQNYKIAAVILISVLAVLIAAIIGVVVYIITYKPPIRDDAPPFDTVGGTDSNGDDKNPGSLKKEENYNMLLVGHDKAAMLADVIMLANYNVSGGKVTIMQIPRDTIVNGSDKINSRFATAYNDAVARGDKDPERSALDGFTDVIEKNFCIKINFSALIDLDAFVNIVDLIGGVEVDVPFDMEYVDPYQDLTISIKAGYQTLDGKTAEGFVRFRSDYVQADIGRTNAQKIFLASMFKKIKNNLNVQTVAGMAEQAFKYVTTDLSLSDGVYFAKNVLSLEFSNILMITAPGDGYGADYVLNRGATIRIINSYFNLYENDISAEVFDLNATFCNMNDPAMKQLYYAASSTIDYEYTVDDALNGDINIPTKNN